MKCPKCGYLGFETTDRCRNCQYDFSLAPFNADQPDLALRRRQDATPDFELPPIKRQTDSLSATALDLDRLFGEAEPPPPPETFDPVLSSEPESPRDPEPETVSAPEPARESPPVSRVRIVDERDMIPPAPVETAGAPDVASVATPALEAPPEPALMHGTPDESSAGEEAVAEDALPFDEVPLVPPPAARTPLAVRRSTPDVPRHRPRTTRPVRLSTLNLEAPAESAPVESTGKAAGETIASLMRTPSLGVRVGAGVIDLVLLLAIDVTVAYLTLRVTGLQNTLDDLRVLPPVPFFGFLAILAFGYVAAFTVGGGQTIGKMMLSLRVIGDDGRPVDAAGGVLRALGCMLVPVTLGLSYLPALFTSDHRALHDRLAGTRVVQE